MSDVVLGLAVSAEASVIKGCCGLLDTECSCTSASTSEENS